MRAFLRLAGRVHRPGARTIGSYTNRTLRVKCVVRYLDIRRIPHAKGNRICRRAMVSGNRRPINRGYTNGRGCFCVASAAKGIIRADNLFERSSLICIKIYLVVVASAADV